MQEMQDQNREGADARSQQLNWTVFADLLNEMQKSPLSEPKQMAHEGSLDQNLTFSFGQPMNVKELLGSSIANQRERGLHIQWLHTSAGLGPFDLLEGPGALTGSICLGVTKTPYFGRQVKYLSPATLPSFFPFGSSNSTPTQIPSLNSVLPANRTIPRPIFFTFTTVPTRGSIVITSYAT
jgi:hypothetical protein